MERLSDVYRHSISDAGLAYTILELAIGAKNAERGYM
jgi:hypothetical protein